MIPKAGITEPDPSETTSPMRMLIFGSLIAIIRLKLFP